MYKYIYYAILAGTQFKKTSEDKKYTLMDFQFLEKTKAKNMVNWILSKQVSNPRR